MTAVDIKVPQDGSIVDIPGLQLDEDRVTVLFGPNGAGKTTILRRLAGIGHEEPLLAASYQPQSAYLFRGLAGYNLGLGLGDEEAVLAGSYAAELGLGDILSRPADLLSGGERQRLVLARALARQAEWVLLDEPLAAIDRKDRPITLAFLAEHLGRRSSVVVTHDLDVAAAVSDQIAVIDHGRCLQHGDFPTVLRSPNSVDVAKILGIGNVIEGVAQTHDGTITLTADKIQVVAIGSVIGQARAIFPGESVVLAPPGSGRGSSRNSWGGTVVEIRRGGSLVEVVVDVGLPVVAVLTSGAVEDLDLALGSPVVASVKAASVAVVPA